MNQSRAHRILLALACGIVLATLLSQPARAAGNSQRSAQPTLSSDTQVATAGFFTLNWRGAPNGRYQLQESASAEFRQPITIYRGVDTARVMSGQEEGKYHYRVRDARQSGAWSRPVTVVIDHHPLARAFAFFTAGLLVFAATAAVIVVGAVRTQEA